MSNDYRTAPIEDVIQAAKREAMEVYEFVRKFPELHAEDIETADILTRLVEELRDARRDVERMEWIAEAIAPVKGALWGEDMTLSHGAMGRDEVLVRWGVHGFEAVRPTLREAIDKAREEDT